ncbi:MAG: hypothetical protein ACRDX8_13080 [Acidimicrobiales bacterium]
MGVNTRDNNTIRDIKHFFHGWQPDTRPGKCAGNCGTDVGDRATWAAGHDSVAKKAATAAHHIRATVGGHAPLCTAPSLKNQRGAKKASAAKRGAKTATASRRP